MDTPAPPTLATVLGLNIRRARLSKHWTQDDLARHVRTFGLKWSRPTVAALETGRKSLDLVEFLLLVSALEITLPQLLSGQDEVDLGGSASLTLEQIRILLASDRTFGRRDRTEAETGEALHGYIEAASTEASEDFLWRIGDAERKAAKRLDIALDEIDALAIALWGRTLTEERERRISEMPNPPTLPQVLRAVRGHLTRDLLAELQSEINDRRRTGGK